VPEVIASADLHTQGVKKLRRSGFFVFVAMNNYPGSEGWQRTVSGRYLLYATTRVEGPVLTGKLL